MPSKQEDKCPSLEDLKAATIVTNGILRYASAIVDSKDLTPELKKKVWELQKKAASLIGLMRREIIAEQKLLQLQREQIDKVFKPSGERRTRK